MELKNYSRTLLKAVCFLLFTLLYFPILFLMWGALYDSKIGKFTTAWIALFMQDEELLSALNRSLLIALTSSLIACLLGLSISLCLRNRASVLNTTLKSFVQQALVLPEITFALALLAWFSVIKFPLGFWSVVIAHVTFSISFVVMIVDAQLAKMDDSLVEAAHDLGATEWVAFIKVTLPQLLPSILSGFLLSFLLSFDDFIISFFVSGAGFDTLPVKLYARSKLGFTPVTNVISALLFILSTAICFLLLKLGSFQNFLKSTRES